MNWADLVQVRKYAIESGPGLIVVKHRDWPHFKIIFGHERHVYMVPGVYIYHCT